MYFHIRQKTELLYLYCIKIFKLIKEFNVRTTVYKNSSPTITYLRESVSSISSQYPINFPLVYRQLYKITTVPNL